MLWHVISSVVLWGWKVSEDQQTKQEEQTEETCASEWPPTTRTDKARGGGEGGARFEVDHEERPDLQGALVLDSSVSR